MTLKFKSLLEKNQKNNFDFNKLQEICENANKNTGHVNFYPVKIKENKFGAKNALIRSKYKENNANTICKIILFENNKGDLRLSVRKGFMFTFINDLKKLQEAFKLPLKKN
jgi:hypothetical protein